MAEYFAHDYDARNDIKIVRMVSEHGPLGYAAFFVATEIMHNEGGSIAFDTLVISVSHYFNLKRQKAHAVVQSMIGIGLITKDESGGVTSKRVQHNLLQREKAAEQRRNAGKKSALSRSTVVEQSLNESTTDAEQLKVKRKSKEKTSSYEEVSKSAHDFQLPLRDHVRTMFKVRGSTDEEADKFFDHYDAQGWVRGNGQLIRNWQAMIPQWIERQKERKHEHKQRTTRGERVGYDRDTTTEYLAEIAGALGGAQGQDARQLDGTAGRQALPGAGDTHPQ